MIVVMGSLSQIKMSQITLYSKVFYWSRNSRSLVRETGFSGFFCLAEFNEQGNCLNFFPPNFSFLFFCWATLVQRVRMVKKDRNSIINLNVTCLDFKTLAHRTYLLIFLILNHNINEWNKTGCELLSWTPLVNQVTQPLVWEPLVYQDLKKKTNACAFVMFQVWQLGSSSPNFTLEGHEKGVNCIDYYSGGDKPYLISGADDRLVKIWDYQVRTSLVSQKDFVHMGFLVSVAKLTPLPVMELFPSE